jgi:transposase
MEAVMQVMHERVAGQDVHKDSVAACVRLMSESKATHECRTFETTTDGLLRLSGMVDRLSMRTGRDRSRRRLLDAGLENRARWPIQDGRRQPAHIRAVPGRKTDVNDAAWIADLAAFGLLKASFVPEEDLHELRTLMRTRKQLVRERSSHVQRIQKTLTKATFGWTHVREVDPDRLRRARNACCDVLSILQSRT